MSESSPGPHQFEDDDTSPGERRPVSLRLPRMEQWTPPPATVEAPKPAEQPHRAGLLFDRVSLERADESRVSAPAAHGQEQTATYTPVPQEIQEIVHLQAEEGEEEEDDDAPDAGKQVTTPAEIETADEDARQRAFDKTPVVPIFTESLAEADVGQHSEPVMPVSQSPRPVPYSPPVAVPAPEMRSDQQESVETVDDGPALSEAMPDLSLDTEQLAEPEPVDYRSEVFNQAPAYQPAETISDPSGPIIPGVPSSNGTSPQAAYGGGFPPVPPPTQNYPNAYGHPPNGPGTPASGPNSNYQSQANYNYAPNYNMQPQAGYTDTDLHRARQAGAVQGVVAGGFAGFVAGRYTARRKFRKEKQLMEKQFAEQQHASDNLAMQQEQTISRLRNDQLDVRDVITGRVADASPHAAAYMPEGPGVSTAPASRSMAEMPFPGPVQQQRQAEVSPAPAFMQAEAPVVPGEVQEEQQGDADPFQHQAEQEPARTEQSAWLKINIDKNNQVMQQEYGRAYHEEVQQEQAGNRQYTSQPQSGHGPIAAPSRPGSDAAPQQMYGAGGGMYIGGVPVAGAGPMTGNNGAGPLPSAYHDPRLASGQVPLQHSLPGGLPSHQDPQHLLPQPKKQIVSNIANPWFWLMLAIIVAAFFAAATI